MSNNILEPIPSNFLDYLLKYPVVTLSNTVPAALPSTTNITWQLDGFGNISACVASSGGGGGSVGTAGQVQIVGATAGSFAASALTDNGTALTTTEPIVMPWTNINGQQQDFSSATNELVIDYRAGQSASRFISLGNGSTAGNFQFLTSLADAVGVTTVLTFDSGNGNAVVQSIELVAGVTATSATAGSATVLPALPLGYLEVALNGTVVKLPYYSV